MFKRSSSHTKSTRPQGLTKVWMASIAFIRELVPSIVRLGTASTFFLLFENKWVLPIQERPCHHYHTNTIPSIQFTFIPLLESFIFIPRQLTSFPSTFLLAFNPSKPPIFSSQNPWWDCGDKVTQKGLKIQQKVCHQMIDSKMLSKAIIHSWKQMEWIWFEVTGHTNTPSSIFLCSMPLTKILW